MSSAVSRRANKRSISSTIVNFFKKENSPEFRESSPIDGPDSTTAGFKEGRTPEPPVPDLILYETDYNTRPPLLPILPVQRLKILRHKQYLRRLNDNRLLETFTAPASNEMSGDFDSSHLVTLRSLKRRANGRPTSKKVPPKSVLGKRWCGDLQYDVAEYDVAKKPKISKPSAGTDPTAALESPRLSSAVLKKSTLEQNSSSSDGLTNTEAKLLNGNALTDLASSKITKKIKKGFTVDDQDDKPKKLLALPSSGFDFLKSNAESSKNQDSERPAEAGNFGKKLLPSSAEATDSPALAKVPSLFDKGKSLEGASQNAAKAEKPETPKPSFSIGKADGTSKPSFSFGKTDDTLKEGKPLFSFKRPTTSDQDENPAASSHATKSQKPSFSFSQSVGASGASQAAPKPAKPAFSFGKPAESQPQSMETQTENATGAADAQVSFNNKPKSNAGFTFGSVTTNAANSGLASSENDPQQSGEKQTEGARNVPSFSFGKAGKPAAEVQAQSSSFKFNTTEPASSGTEKKAAPAFSFSNPATEAKAATPVFSFGTSKTSNEPNTNVGKAKSPSLTPSDSASIGSKRSFTFGVTPDQPSSQTANAPLSTQSNSKTPAAPSKPFTFGATSEKKDSTPPAFSFNTAGQPDGQSAASAASSTGSGFKFDTSGLKVNEPRDAKSSFTFGSNSAAPKPAFNLGSSTHSFNAPQPQQPNSAFTFNNPSSAQQPLQQPQPNGIGFPSASTTSNNSPAFGNTTNQQLAFNFGTGNATASSTPPPFGSASAPAFTPNPQSRPFSPSHTVNLNFGGVGSQPPSTIFGGAANQNPAQVFGAQPNGSHPFPGMSQAPSQIFGGSSTSSIPQPQNQQTPMLNLPPGRKLARMRARRT
ncbi:FG-nucleoporin NUP1 [Lachancea thermotolerans CBS 6340]|uniref:KLTH0G07964p n=1 Tax=Lachancea thermotolerans (strain ATCC 56472 / CBS 6340 / NRRL Y-8284) TaxID=559295 RepID=C5DMD5_LACTC|nr:KLTH0G07964p [Lachancea thermotolerans CBS 6340]CAR24946.1 KLTH0G07964p [Lachancea thermotolerans CBS 6340]